MYTKFIKFAPAAVLGLGMVMGVAQAQDQQAAPQPGGPGGRRGGQMDPDRQIQAMRQKLNLTDDQVSQIRPILADAQKQSTAARSDSTLSDDDRRAKMMSIREDSTTKIKAVLTDAQKKQYDDMMAARRQQMMQQRQQQPQGTGDTPAPNPNQ